MKTQSQNELMTCNVKKMGLQSIVATGLLITAMSANAAVVYNNDFSSDTGDFTENLSTEWSVAGGVYNNDIGNVNRGSTAFLPLASIGTGTGVDFTMTTSFNPTSSDGENTTIGFAALAQNSTDSGDYLLADWNPHSQITRILFVSGTGLASVNGSYSPTPENGNDHTMTLTGTYSGTTLSLSLELTDGTTTSSPTTATLDSSNFADLGNYFGFRNRTGSVSGDDLDVDFAFLTLETTGAVPEPSSTALLLLGTGLLLAGRKRKSMRTLNHV